MPEMWSLADDGRQSIVVFEGDSEVQDTGVKVFRFGQFVGDDASVEFHGCCV